MKMTSLQEKDLTRQLRSKWISFKAARTIVRWMWIPAILAMIYTIMVFVHMHSLYTIDLCDQTSVYLVVGTTILVFYVPPRVIAGIFSTKKYNRMQEMLDIADQLGIKDNLASVKEYLERVKER